MGLPAVAVLGNRIMIYFSLISGASYPQPIPRCSGDGNLAPHLYFSFAIGGWIINFHGLSSFGGYYYKQRQRTGPEGTRGPLGGVARRGGGVPAERRGLPATPGRGGRSSRLPDERDPQLLQSRGANNGCARWPPARGGSPRARRPCDNGRAFRPVPLL